MKDITTHENLILTSYFFHKNANTFLLRPKKEKSTHDIYNETSEQIKIVRILQNNGIIFLEEENGDIKIV
ncbi:MAG: hypothetical protein C0625_13170 [Arcobacter sp.]|nr:MAG: hypothetical protein C0625_13170 [Arcobacter sp.]